MIGRACDGAGEAYKSWVGAGAGQRYTATFRISFVLVVCFQQLSNVSSYSLIPISVSQGIRVSIVSMK